MEVYRHPPHSATSSSKLFRFLVATLLAGSLVFMFSLQIQAKIQTDPLATLRQTLSLQKQAVNFSLTITDPPKPREVNGLVSEVEGKILFRAPGSFLLTLTYPTDRNGARIDISPKGSTLYNPTTKTTKALPSGATGSPLYGSPLSVSALNLISSLSDLQSKWTKTGAKVLVKHPLFGTSTLLLDPKGRLSGFELQGKLPARVSVLKFGPLGKSKQFPIQTKWQFINDSRGSTAVLELSNPF